MKIRNCDGFRCLSLADFVLLIAVIKFDGKVNLNKANDSQYNKALYLVFSNNYGEK